MPEWDDDERSPGTVKKSLDYDVCPRHGMSYPKGGDCPLCLREQQERNKK